MREPIHHWLLIIAVAAVVFFFNLGQPRLWDRDEPRNAGCAAEMMTRGDWVVPIFNDQLVWMPHLSLMKGRNEFQFATSDSPGKFEITIWMSDEKGQRFEVNQYFIVE